MANKSTWTEWTPLFLRLGLGVLFLGVGVTKLLTLKQTQAYFASLLPVPQVFLWIVILAELLGGLGVLAGVLTRWASLGLALLLLLIILIVHLPNITTSYGYVLSNFALLTSALALASLGSGKWAILRD